MSSPIPLRIVLATIILVAGRPTAAETVYSFDLAGTEQDPPVSTTASGKCLGVLNSSGTALEVTCVHDVSNATSARVERSGDSGAGEARETVLRASRDNTLYEDSAGELSNGAGQHLFVGRTNQATNNIRRGLVAFDSSSIPSGSRVDSAAVIMNLSRSQGTIPVSLHRALNDWDEGNSNAGERGGGGAAATSADATWVHTMFDTQRWDEAGGDFVASASATLTVSTPRSYTWNSNASLVSDVQGWIDDATQNFGWAVLGDENTSRSAKRFDSRESSEPPQLRVNYTTAAGNEVVFEFASVASPFQGTVTLTPDDLADLRDGALSVNIQSDQFPEGEIRGTIENPAAESYVFMLGGNQEVPAVDTAATGKCAGALDDTQTQFTVACSHDVTDTTAAHIHNQRPTENGSIVFPFSAPNSPFMETWMLGAMDLSELRAGRLYVNVHSTNHPTGEIRGQIFGPPDGSSSGSWFDPERNGEGFLLELVNSDNPTLVAYWFTYEPGDSGRQIWVVGSGPIDANIGATDSFIAEGGSFGDGFDPADVMLTAWGTITLTFTSCTTAVVEYNSTLAGFGSGTFNLVRLNPQLLGPIDSLCTAVVPNGR